MIVRVHVNQHVIKRNQKTGEREPVFTIKQGGKTHKANSVTFPDGCELVYRPDKPLSCGARAWIETTKVTYRK